jgi:Fe-S cluster assembly ATP-binding protein
MTATGEVLLEIENLWVSVAGKEILRGVDLVVRAGEVHALMGPNGSGKSTLSHVLAGKDGYDVMRGEVRFLGKDLLGLAPEQRAREGVFLAFQYPVEIPGITNGYFMRTAVNAVRTHRGLPTIDAFDFLALAKEKLKLLEMDPKFLERAVNEGFSGGEKKRNEILQLALLEPRLAVLDETDSGLDIDALRVVANGVNQVRGCERGVLVITHYPRLLEHVVPDVTHVLVGGRIVKTGDRSLALELEKRGYGWLDESAAAIEAGA